MKLTPKAIVRTVTYPIVKDGVNYLSTVQLTVDVDGLLNDLGRKAARNVSGKSVEASGMIEARRIGCVKQEAPTGGVQ